MKHLIIAAALAASACAQFGPTKDQIDAMQNTSSSFCTKVPGWNGSPVEAHFASFGGKSTGTAGGGGKATCGASVVEFTNEGKAPASVRVTP